MPNPTPTDADRALAREYLKTGWPGEVEALATLVAQARQQGEEAMREKAIDAAVKWLVPGTAEIIESVIRALLTGD